MAGSDDGGAGFLLSYFLKCLPLTEVRRRKSPALKGSMSLKFAFTSHSLIQWESRAEFQLLCLLIPWMALIIACDLPQRYSSIPPASQAKQNIPVTFWPLTSLNIKLFSLQGTEPLVYQPEKTKLWFVWVAHRVVQTAENKLNFSRCRCCLQVFRFLCVWMVYS